MYLVSYMYWGNDTLSQTERFWKITDFSKQIGKHQNTVDGWFKQLEEKRLHYVNRISNEKVYDELDLQIALHIKDKREQKWALEAIFDELSNHFDLRPLPPEMETTNSLQVTNMETIKRLFSEEVRRATEEIAAVQTAEIIRALPKPKSREEERQERFEELMTRYKVEKRLREEALHLWSTKPENERMRKVGWFRKEENRDKRDQFVRDYIDEHFVGALRKEYGLE